MNSFSDLAQISQKVRKLALESITQAHSGHPAGSLSSADILTALYFGVLKHDPKNPNWEERDRFILSNGHVCPALYATLALSGYFPESELSSLREIGSRLQGHPQRGKLPGIETTSGPLGSGLAQAVGIALGGRLDGKNFRVYCLTSDGEHNSGNHWEAVMVAAKYKLTNLIVIVDKNGIQLSGRTDEIMPLGVLEDKYKAFGFSVFSVNGHDFAQIIEAFERAKEEKEKPVAIIAKTVAGKGVSFMEGRWEWHGKALSQEELKKAVEELGV